MEKSEEIVKAQIDGDPLVIQPTTRSNFEAELSRLVNYHSMEKNTPDFMLAKFMVLAMNLFQQLSDERDRWKGPGENDANFGFYVDGYTLTGTPIIGEILVTAMDGRSAIIKSASLVAFLDRRLSPNVFPEDKPQG